MATQWELLLVDADVLIDYALADVSILGLAARHVGSVYVVHSVLDEVTQLRTSDCDRLGIRIVQPSLEQLLKAGEARGRLSFNDRLSLLVAHDAGWTCVSNDRALRRACAEHQVPVWWGLELMLALVRTRELEGEIALAVAQAIHLSNPRHITAEILERFAREVASQGQRSAELSGWLHLQPSLGSSVAPRFWPSSEKWLPHRLRSLIADPLRTQPFPSKAA